MSKDWTETRNIALEGAGRTTIQLEPEAWALVDAVAEARNQDWRAWVEDAIRQPAPEGISRTAWLRICAMKQFREIALRNGLDAAAQQRADAMAAGDPFANPELDSVVGYLDDDRLAEHLSECAVEGAADMGGFVLHIGFDEFQRRCFWIENRLKGALSVVISIPKES